MGKSVFQAVDNVNTVLADALEDWDIFDQKGIDAYMNELDGTENKGKIGAMPFWVYRWPWPKLQPRKQECRFTAMWAV